LLFRQRQQRRRREFAARRLLQPVEDGLGRLAVQLLEDDGARQRPERRRTRLNYGPPHAFDDGRQHGIGFLQV